MNNIIQPITIKSIESVPRAIIFDDTNINRMLQEQSKEILRLSMNRTDGHRYDEVGRLLCIQNPNDYVDIYGSWDDTLKTCIIRPYRNERYAEMVYTYEANKLVFIHNHPNNSIISGNDLFNLFTEKSIYIVIAVSNNGSISYAFKNSDIDYMKIYKSAIKAIYSYNNTKERLKKQEEVFEKIFSNPEKYGIGIYKSERK
jgi:hypothetical protein